MHNRRADLRARTGLTGRILSPSSPALACLILDLSSGGAGLMATTREPIPDLFDLALPDAARGMPVRLVWQRDGRAGVAFLRRRPVPPVMPDLPLSAVRRG